MSRSLDKRGSGGGPRPEKNPPEEPKEIGKQLSWPYSERLRKVFQFKERMHKKDAEEASKEAEAEYKATSDRDGTLKQVCGNYAKKHFPGIGKVSHSVPYCFIDKHDIKPDKEIVGAHQHKAESDCRGDNAHCKVERAFRLLSQKMEREKPGEEQAMVILGNVLYESFFIHLRDKDWAVDLIPNVKEKCRDRRAPDLIILQKDKGVIFVEVKSFNEDNKPDRKEKEDKNAFTQLDKDVTDFLSKLEHLQGMDILKVAAFPNMSREEAQKYARAHDKDGKCQVLAKEDLFEEDLEKAEAEYTLEPFQSWWENLKGSPIEIACMEDIVGRFMGTLSKPIDFEKTSERTHARTPADAISLVARIFKTVGLNLSDEDKQNLKETKVHLMGQPGSGRTTMLVLKAIHFLKDDTRKQKHVIVVDLYRGAPGRRIGFHIVGAIRHSTSLCKGGGSRVHRLPIDVNLGEDFNRKVRGLFATGRPSSQNLLFILDEILPFNVWKDTIWADLQNYYQKSQVWFADGLDPRYKLKEQASSVKTVELKHSMRIPASVLRVLLHADSDEGRTELYRLGLRRPQPPTAATVKSPAYVPAAKGGAKTPAQKRIKPNSAPVAIASPAPTDSPSTSGAGAPTEERGWVVTDGPTALCVRHKDHKVKTLLDCHKCPEILATLLKDQLKLVVQDSTDHAGGSGAGASSSPGPGSFLPCSIVILYGIPESRYQEKPTEVTEENFNEYANEISNSAFISRLRKRLPLDVSVQMLEPPREENLDITPTAGKLEVLWTDLFQGIEADVVIYLPAAESKLEPHHKQGGVDRLPGVASDKRNSSKWPAGALSSAGSAAPPQGTSERPERKGQKDVSGDDAQGASGGYECQSDGARGIADMYWRTGDVAQYTDWDRVSLVQAAICCSGQFIMIVP